MKNDFSFDNTYLYESYIKSEYRIELNGKTLNWFSSVNRFCSNKLNSNECQGRSMRISSENSITILLE